MVETRLYNQAQGEALERDNGTSRYKVQLVDSSGSNLNSTNPLPVDLQGKVDTNNETTTPLLSGQTFTGTSTEITNYASIGLMVYADVNSANDGLVVQFSFDNVSWRDGETYTIPAGTPKFFTPPKQGKYYRVKYTNNGTNQTEFHIHTLLSKTPIKWSSHNINANLNDDDDSELVSAVLKLRTAQNTYVSGSATTNGNFKVSNEEYNGDIKSKGFPTRAVFNTNDIEEASSTVTYIGMQNEVGDWYIKKIDTTSGCSFGHANVVNNVAYTTYSAAWTARASLTYGDYEDMF